MVPTFHALSQPSIIEHSRTTISEKKKTIVLKNYERKETNGYEHFFKSRRYNDKLYTVRPT